MQAPETTGTEEDTARVKVARHYLIDAAGAEVEEEEKATGIGYHLVGVDAPFTYQVQGAAAGSAQTMLAIFGAKTLATNESSAVRNGKSKGDVHEQLDAVVERFKLIDSGTWIDRTREGVGAKVDIPTLVTAWCNVVTAAGKTVSKTPDQLVEILTDKPDMVKQLRKDPKVVAEYAKLRGAAAVDAGDLMDTI